VPKQVDHDARRRELTSAVRRVVGSGGLESLTVRAIAKESGWSTGVLAHYFDSRAELLRAAFQDVYAAAQARIEARLAEHDDAIEGIRAALGEAVPLTESLRTDTTVWWAFVGLAVGDPDLRETAHAGYDRWTTYFGEVIRAAHPGGISQAEAQRIARRFTALVDGLTVQALFDPDALPPAVLREEIRLAVDREFAAGGKRSRPVAATRAPARRKGSQPVPG
jgi:AcrR family transcriptional regulator